MPRFLVLIAVLLTLAACGGEEPATDETPGCIPRSGAASFDPARVVAFVGDSVTARWHLPCDFVNLGIDGQASGLILPRFDRDVLSLRPNIVALLAGTNDLLTVSQPTVDAIARMTDLAQQSGACVILGTVPPMKPQSFNGSLTGIASQAELDQRLATFNAEILSLARSRGVLLADYHGAMTTEAGGLRAGFFSRDGVHPSRRGHQAMFSVVSPLLQRCP